MIGSIITIDRSIHHNSNQITLGIALTELKKLPDSFINVCVTSPPYWNRTGTNDSMEKIQTSLIMNQQSQSMFII
jgi:DNA modification methylase